jgi:UDP-glucose 4-epimerase
MLEVKTMPKNKVIVTGGAGFIGSHLSHKLVDLGYDVVILDNLTRGRCEHIQDLIDAKKAKFIEGDIRNSQTVRDVVRGAKYVFHEAAVCINYSVAHPEESIQINVDGSFNVFKAASDTGVEKLIFASSASVYGNPQYLPMDEKHPFNPITPYCVSKIAGEYALRIFAPKGLKYNILRNFNVYGPRQSVDAFYSSVIINFMKNVQGGKPPVICGDGSQTMDFVNVHDVVDANILAAESDVWGEAFNVGSGVSTSVKTLAETVIKLFSSKLKPDYQKEQKIIVRRRQADISKINKMLKFKARVGFEAGLAEVAKDITKHPEFY